VYNGYSREHIQSNNWDYVRRVPNGIISHSFGRADRLDNRSADIDATIKKEGMMVIPSPTLNPRNNKESQGKRTGLK
jgi:hypothetical protein